VIIDSSVWLEILRSGPLQIECERYIQKGGTKIPTLALYEVYKKIKTKVSEDVALEAVAVLSNFELVDLNREIALLAADLSIEHNMGMADSIVLACARYFKEKLVTLDNDFAGITNVIVIRPKR
jgi:predicted nucleic acid-binding protein